ncbi:uncharacterized protein VTP21DRAFT_5382 [Calcarisporiella thermophila]|uniref:uncharacterized protein n=1 Tax=Calcarisporiella thermophila TaxID=911321 RepID=UPI003743D2B6
MIHIKNTQFLVGAARQNVTQRFIPLGTGAKSNTNILNARPSNNFYTNTARQTSWGQSRLPQTQSGQQLDKDQKELGNAHLQRHTISQYHVSNDALRRVGGVRFQSSTAIEPLVGQSVSIEELSFRQEERAQYTDSQTQAFNSRILALKRQSDLAGVLAEFEHMKQKGIPLTPHTYNLVIDAYANLRSEGSPITQLLQVYEEMLSAGWRPSTFTYSTLIRALCKRDAEVQRSLDLINRRKRVKETETASDIRADALQKENNAEIALQIFRSAVHTNRVHNLEIDVFNMLIRALANRGEASQAVYVFEQLENSPSAKPNALSFASLIQAHAKAGDLLAAENIFNDYQKLKRSLENQDATPVYAGMTEAYLQCGNVDKASQLVEQVVASDHVAIGTQPYNALIGHLCRQGNLTTAFNWLERMQQEKGLPRPDGATYGSMLAGLCQHGEWSQASRVYDIISSSTEMDLSGRYTDIASYAYLCLQHEPARVLDLFRDMERFELAPDSALMESVVNEFVRRDEIALARDALDVCARAASLKAFTTSNKQSIMDTAMRLFLLRSDDLSHQLAVLHAIYPYGLRSSAEAARKLLDNYTLQREASGGPQSLNLGGRDYFMLFDSLLMLEHDPAKFREIAFTLVRDMKQLRMNPSMSVYNRIAQRLLQIGDHDGAGQWRRMFDHMIRSQTPNPGEEGSGGSNGRLVSNERSEAKTHEMLSAVAREDFAAALKGCRSMIEEGLLPHADTAAQVIAMVGKKGKLEECRALFEMLDKAFGSIELPALRHRARSLVLNSMLIAFADNGDTASARQCYDEVIALGYHPNANAYASYLLSLSDSVPDESAEAWKIYEEVRRRNIRPTTYLYNVIISKLAKGRKCELAVQVLEDLKRHRLHPNAVTYGAVISACLRAGNEERAVSLFREMEESSEYQPRIGPYNNMMQFYTRQQPDRARCLHYFSEMKAAGIRPSQHTYKLLIEAFAVVEPQDLDAARQLLEDMRLSGVKPAATHYATLIHAHASRGDVVGAERLFEEMRKRVVPDDTPYQALLEAYVEQGNISKIESLMNGMLRDGVQSTPYIKNLLIRAHGQSDLARAEMIFGSMTDDKSPGGAMGGAVLREPSTYEAMVRVYLLHGETERAKWCVDRMSSLGYPELVIKPVAELLVK